MQYADLLQAVIAKVNSIAGLPVILYPGINYSIQTANHIRLDVLAAPTEPVGISSVDWQRGIISLLVRVKDGKGALGAAAIADLILAAFPRGTVMGSARVDSLGYVAPAIIDGGWYQLPVTIPYNILT